MSNSILTLGTFDGVHRGHQQIMRQVLSRARQNRARSVVLTFDRPPRHHQTRSPEPFLLTTLSEKKAILRRLGIDAIQILHFTPRLARIEPEVFFQKIIVDRWKSSEMVVGPRVAFGKNRRGRLSMLRALGERKGVNIRVVDPVSRGRSSIASSRIRAMLLRGNVEEAARLLGYLYSVAGKVVHGDRRGRSLGYPTANLRTPQGKILPRGVFWVKVLSHPGDTPIPARTELMRGWDGLCNVGVRPTFNQQAHKLVCEVFLLNSPGTLYGRTLRVFFLKRLRSERRFKSSADLVRQINLDFKHAKKWARNNFLRKFSLPFE